MMNPYEVLGVPEDADKQTIKKAYRKLAAEHHPDRGGADGAKPWRLDGAQGGQAQYLNPFSFLYLL